MPDRKTYLLYPCPSVNLNQLVNTLIMLVLVLAISACDLRLDNDALITRARSAAELNDYRTAIIDLKTVLQRDPQNSQARLALGKVYLRAAEPYAAEKELRKAIEIGTPKSDVVVYLGEALLAQEVHDLVLAEITEEDAANDQDRISLKLIRADAHLALGHLDASRQIYVEVIEKDPENPAAYLGLASTYLLEQQAEQAAVSIDRAIEVAPDFAPAWLARAMYRLNRRSPEAAKSDFQRVADLAIAGDDLNTLQTALAGLTDVHLLQGDLQSADMSAARLNSIAKDSLIARYTSARVAVAKEEFETAVVLLQGVLKDAPDFRQAHLLYGIVSRAKGNLAQAEMYLASAVRAWPENADARKLLADVRLRQNKLRGASEAIGPLVNIEGNVDDYLLAAAGAVKLQSGEYSEGLELFERSVKADPKNLERKMDLAAIYLAIGRLEQAVEILESLAGTNVDKHRLDVLNVVSIQRRGDAAGAVRTAEQLVELSPDNIQLLLILSGLREESGNFSAARRSLEHVLQLDTENIDALLGLGRIDIAENNYADARLRFRRALQISPESASIASAMARLAALEGDTATSVSWLEKARHSSDDTPLPRIQLAAQYLSQQRLDEAKLVAEEAVRIDESDPRARNVLGVTQMVSGDFRAAAGNFAEAIRLAPDVAAYRYNNARAQFKTGNQRAALKTIEENYEAHPDHVASAILLAVFQLRENNFRAASAVAQRLQAAFPTKAAGLLLRGDILAAQGQFDEAVRLYDRAITVEPSRDLAVRAYKMRVKASHAEPYGPILSYLEANPADSAARMYLAETYHASGEVDAAQAQYERSLQANPENVVALNNLAWILFDKGQPRALQIAENAYRILPDNAAIADTYGWILLNRSKSEDAVAVLRKAAETMPGDADIQYHFAVALLEFGDKAEAYAALEKIVASDQTFSSRREAEQLFRKIQGN